MPYPDVNLLNLNYKKKIPTRKEDWTNSAIFLLCSTTAPAPVSDNPARSVLPMAKS